eukprot:TRINITY_DN22576_c0_g1_i1.p1 TRINITY_DN22576_c0_g1~~TRINITY_DN22576_c0_g1_i1.p1  ORF type:complete len:379 (-),score=116.72 TRINITY_DN22576_c0_g1_i1:149-1285(-)
MVVQRLWNFVKRHRKKFIVGGVVAGGAYYAWRVWLPRAQQRLLEQLLKDLAEGGEAQDQGRNAQEKAKQRFQHQQECSDNYARKSLQAFLAGHRSCFNIDACHTKVKEAKDKEAKLAAFRELQVECLSMLTSACYSLHVLLLLHRIEFNIAGREIHAAEQRKAPAEADTKEAAVIEEFFKALDFFAEKGPAVVVSAARTAVEACAVKDSLSPQSVVTAETLSSFFRDVFRAMDEAILAENKGASILLPPDDADVPPSDQAAALIPVERSSEVKQLLDEARDYLESPQLLSAFRSVADAATTGLPAQLASADPKAAALLEEGGSLQLARLFGSAIEVSKLLLSEDAEACEANVSSFAQNAVVTTLCEGLYFQDRSTLAA